MKFTLRALATILTLSLICLSISTNAFALSIDEAYRAIPHRRTVFKLNQAKMSNDEKEFLDEFLHLVDLAMVQRVEMLLWLSTNGQRGSQDNNYAQILDDLASLDVPSTLKEVHKLVIEAIKQQRSFLEGWQKGPERKHNFASDPQVSGASQKLRSAYSQLMRLYPNEGQQNKQAFFDYLCTLDFI